MSSGPLWLATLGERKQHAMRVLNVVEAGRLAMGPEFDGPDEPLPCELR